MSPSDVVEWREEHVRNQAMSSIVAHGRKCMFCFVFYLLSSLYLLPFVSPSQLVAALIGLNRRRQGRPAPEKMSIRGGVSQQRLTWGTEYADEREGHDSSYSSCRIRSP